MKLEQAFIKTTCPSDFIHFLQTSLLFFSYQFFGGKLKEETFTSNTLSFFKKVEALQWMNVFT